MIEKNLKKIISKHMIIDINSAMAELLKNECEKCRRECTIDLEEECWHKIEKIIIEILNLKEKKNV